MTDNQIMEKLDIHTIAGLTRHAIKIGLVDTSRHQAPKQ